MSGWELFTWINVVILGVGSIIVFVLFLKDFRSLLPRRDRHDDNN